MIDVDKASVVDEDVTLLAPVSVAARRGETLIIRGSNSAGLLNKLTFRKEIALLLPSLETAHVFRRISVKGR